MHKLMPAMGWLLALSCTANAALAWAWLHQRDEAARLGTMVQTAESALGECIQHTRQWQDKAHQAAQQVKAAQARAHARATLHDKAADTALQAPPAVPGDDCASAQQRARQWLEQRP